MKRLLQPHFRSIAAGIGIYVLFFSIVIFSVNAFVVEYPRNFVARALMGFLAYFPFLAAGYYTAVRSHPAGVFNSVLVGAIIGTLTVLYAFSQPGNPPPQYVTVTGFLGGVTASLVICSLGGVLGTVKCHYTKK